MLDRITPSNDRTGTSSVAFCSLIVVADLGTLVSYQVGDTFSLPFALVSLSWMLQDQFHFHIFSSYSK
jgi:hypothetical protein